MFAAAAAIAGCGGGSGSSGSGFASVPGPGHNGGGTQIAVRIVIPNGSTAARRRPNYVGLSTQSAVVEIAIGDGQSLVVGNNYANISVGTPTPAPTGSTAPSAGSGSGCTNSGSGTTCSFTISAAIPQAGTYDMLVATYDQPQTASCIPDGTPACAGKLLSLSTVPQTITPGSSNALNIALGGLPAQFQPLQLVSGYIGGAGNNTHNVLNLYGPQPAVVDFELLDADNNVIAGPGSPVVTGSSSPALTIAVSPNPNGGVYTATFTPVTVSSAIGPVVQPTTVPLSLNISIPGTNVSNLAVQVASLNIKHSAIYVGAPYASTCNATSVYAYFDGNTTAVMPNGYCTGTSALPLATDHSDGLWVADYGNNELLGWSTDNQPLTGAWSENYGVCGSGGCSLGATASVFTAPGGLTFDWANNAYVSNVTGSSYEIWSFAAPAPTSTPSWLAASLTYPSTPTTNLVYEGLSVDSDQPTTHLYVAQTNTTTFTSAFGAFNVGTPTFLNITGASQVLGTALDPSSNVWVLINPTGSGLVAEEIDAGTGAVLQTLSVPSTSSGIAVDSLGTVYIAGGTLANSVLEFKPPLYTATAGPSISSPTTIAVVPNGLFGNNNALGSQTPLPSPIPLRTNNRF